VTVTIAVPRAVITQARSHYRELGRPWLFDPRPGEGLIYAVSGDTCYLLSLDMDFAEEIGLLDLTEGDTVEERAAHLVLLLANVPVCIIGSEPIRFLCWRREVGLVEIIESPFGPTMVRVRDHLSLTCLSWLLFETRAGYYLALYEAAADQ
jgi:hypothetical protein